MGWMICACVFFSAQSLFAMSVEDVPNPRRSNAWVSDTIGVFSPEGRQSINAKLTRLNKSTGVEVALVTVEEVDTATPKEFATELFNYWGIGQRSSQNGLLILLVRGERRLEMETGYGMEAVLSDGWLKRMQGEKMVPLFKQDNYAQGLVAGVDAVNQRVHQKSSLLALSASGAPTDVDDEGGVPWWMWVFGLGGGGALSGFGFKRYRYKKDRTCPTCQKPMEMLPEEEDDVHLDAGQIVEEQIGSIDYQYYYCLGCEFHRLLPVKSWFGGHRKCGQCGYRTQTTETCVLEHPTTYSSGLEEITKSCAHCGFHSRRTRRLPRISESSSSSSGFSSGGGGGGGGGSFGGGSSGGGGAGSSW